LEQWITDISRSAEEEGPFLEVTRKIKESGIAYEKQQQY
jgi:hypothetical protein